MKHVNLWNDDCVKVMSRMKANTFDAVISDPPYGVNVADWDDDIPSQHILDECLRLSRGVVIWFGSASRMLDFATYNPRPDRVMIWSPKFTLAKVASHGLAYRFHPIAIWNIAKQDIIAWDVVDDMTETGNPWFHPATKPVTLMRKLVAAWGGESVFDPFMGSGTTGVACVQLGVAFTGCERDDDYYSIASKRIDEARRQLRLL